MLSSQGTRSPSCARRWWIAITAATIAVAGGSLAYRRVLPVLVAGRVERMLAAHGFPGAHVGAADLGLRHLRLEDVTLGDGLAIGAVEIDAGVSLLWRIRIHQITLCDAALSARWVDRLAPPASAPASELPFDVVRIERGTVALGEVRAAVSGTIAQRAGALSVDLQATSARVALGEIELGDVRASLRSAGAGQLRACVTGRIAGGSDAAVATAWACGIVPAALGDLRALRAIDVAFAAATPGWRLRGSGAVGWASTPAITGGRVTVDAPAVRTDACTLHGVRFSGDLAGRLAGRELQLDVTGVAEADRVELAGRSVAATARAVRAPLVGRAVLAGGAVRLTPRRPVLATARDASVRVGDVAVELTAPLLAAFPAHQAIVVDRALAVPGALRWSASAARLRTARSRAPSGTLSSLRRAAEAEWGSARFREPSGTLLAGRTLSWRAAEAEWGGARFQEPSGTLLAGRTLSWRAAGAEWGGARFRAPSGVIDLDASRSSRAAWAQVTGPGPLALGAGEIGFHGTGDRLTIDRGRASALGGEVAIDPVVWPASGDPAPVALIVHARGLELHRVLAAFAHGHADGDGVLDGELALRIDDAGTTVERGALEARAAGGLRLSDAAWRARASASAAGFALHQRIAATLSDFEYSRLAAILRPAGTDPELQITTRGRGKRVAQDLDLVVNLRGVRDAARHLPFAQSPRSQP